MTVLELTEEMIVSNDRDPWGDAQRINARRYARLRGEVPVSAHYRRKA